VRATVDARLARGAHGELDDVERLARGAAEGALSIALAPERVAALVRRGVLARWRCAWPRYRALDAVSIACRDTANTPLEITLARRGLRWYVVALAER